MSTIKGFVLCADDYGFTPGVSDGILQLLDAGRISATGAMTNRPDWPRAARLLKAFDGKADLGLHLNLTAGAPLTPMPNFAAGGFLPTLGPVLKRATLRRLPIMEIGAEIERQLDAFEQAMGRIPDFIDGHQHVHAVRGVRATLLRIVAERYPQSKPYIRNPADRATAILARRIQTAKAMLIARIAGGLARDLALAGIASNQGFSGVSAFDAKADYADEFARSLVAPGTRHLVMCHPGLVDDELRASDPVIESRPKELAFFLGPRFDEICTAAGTRAMRFRDLPAVGRQRD